MESLPQEVFYCIFENIYWDDLRNTLTVCKRFQLATEERRGCFKTIKLRSNGMQKLVGIYKSHRLQFLQRIDFQTIAPALDWQDGLPCRDTVDDLREIDEAFSTQISQLFSTLKKIENLMHGRDEMKSVSLTIRSPIRDVSELCLHRRYVCWRVHLLSPRSLPELLSINSLELIEDGAGKTCGEEAQITPSKLDLRILLDLSVKLPNLLTLRCMLINDDWTTAIPDEVIKHYTRAWEGPCRDARHDFANAANDLRAIMPNKLEDFQLDFIEPFNESNGFDQRQLLPNLVAPSRYDPFGTSLRSLSYQLRTLRLRVVADEALFRGLDNGGEPCWPNLENLEICFHMATPRGGWYFYGPRGEGRKSTGFAINAASYPPVEPNDEDRKWDHVYNTEGYDWSVSDCLEFRVVPNDDSLVPFLAAFGNAASHMPRLKKAAIWCPLGFCAEEVDKIYIDYDDQESGLNSDQSDKLAWGIVYAAAGQDSFVAVLDNPQEPPSTRDRLWWKVGKWRPDDTLHHKIRQIGRRHVGDTLEEIWGDTDSGQNLVARNVFQTLAVTSTSPRWSHEWYKVE